MGKMVNNQLSIINRKGSVLLVVLFVIMAITVLSLGFLSSSDVELACGQNMALRLQMDQLADSGLQHARGLVLNPQETAGEYWTGAAGQQLVAGSNDYYDVVVVRDESDPNDRCNYVIDCNAYRISNGEQTARSDLTAELRLDPCIGLWTGTATTLWRGLTVYGDVYCDGALTNEGAVYGDVFAASLSGTGTKAGQTYAVGDLSLQWPRITYSDFVSRPTYTKLYLYNPTIGAGDIPAGTYISYRNGDLTITGGVEITGMLLVNGSVTIQGANKIAAAKNLPALYVTSDLIVEKGASLESTGLVVVGRDIRVGGSTSLNVLGGLFIYRGAVQTAADASGKGNTATLYNGPTWQPSGGRSAGALSFDGVNDHLRTPNDPIKLQLVGNYTLSVWIKPNSAQKNWAGILSKCDSTGSTSHWTMQFNSDTPKKLIIYHPEYWPDPKWWDTGITLTDVAGGWHHVSVVRDGITMRSYLDGVPRHSSMWVNPAGFGNGHLNIGVDKTAATSRVYTGLIDDMRIYNRALDPNDIYPPKGGLPGLIGHWELDEADPAVAITAAPTQTAIICWSQYGTPQRWGQAAGAFFRSVSRR